MHKDDDPGARTRLQLLRTGLRNEGGCVKQEEQGERNELDFNILSYNLIPSVQNSARTCWYAPAGGVVRGKPTLILAELDTRFRAFLLDVYHRRGNAETRMPPAERWEANGFLPRMPDSLEQLDLLLTSQSRHFDKKLGRTRLPVASIQMPCSPSERDLYEGLLPAVGSLCSPTQF